MNSYTAAWVAWIATFAAVEGKAVLNKQEGDTLSEHFRKWFRTHTRGGKLAFAVAWLGFSGWFFGHILELWP